jgi:hypothetical protein
MHFTVSEGAASAATIVGWVRPRVTVLLPAAVVLAVAAGASARGVAQPNLASPSLWATVDVCDTASQPDTIGIRGSMPGTGDSSERMFMRFSVEYRRRHVWHPIGGGSSTLVAVGSGDAQVRQAGQSFTIAPTRSHGYLLRGVVTYVWRLGARTVATTLRSTTAGHVASAGADPPGYSAGLCSIAPKRRGSFVITPVTPSPASHAIRAASSTVHT